MKTRYLLPTLLIAFCTTVTAQAEHHQGDHHEHSSLSDKLKVSGNFQTRVESHSPSSSFGEQEDAAHTRLRFDLDYRHSDVLAFRLSPQAVKYWGEPQTGDSTGDTITGTSGSPRQPEMDFFEAYAKVYFSQQVELSLGRIALKYGDQKVIGPLLWAPEGRAFDGAKLRYDLSNKQWIDAFATKITNSDTRADAQDDTNFYGLYSHFSFGTWLNEFDFYLLRQEERSNEVEFKTYGLRLKGGQSFHYLAEVTAQSGNNSASQADFDDAIQYDVELGYNLGASKLRVGYAHAGEDYRQLYPTAHLFLGIADIFGRRNIDELRAGYNLTLAESFVFDLSYHSFTRVSDESEVFKLTGAALSGTTASTSDDLGSEIDLLVTWKFHPKSMIQFGAAFYTVGEILEDTLGDDDVEFYYLSLVSNF